MDSLKKEKWNNKQSVYCPKWHYFDFEDFIYEM